MVVYLPERLSEEPFLCFHCQSKDTLGDMKGFLISKTNVVIPSSVPKDCELYFAGSFMCNEVNPNLRFESFGGGER